MKIFLLAFLFTVFASKVFSQQFSQYNTGTVYESFENPAVCSFIPDSSRKFAFNLFIPSVSGNFYLTGNSQASLKGRAFNGRYDASQLTIGPGAINRVNQNGNIYFIQFKYFSNLSSNGEMGFSAQSRTESRGQFTDESVAIFSGSSPFKEDHYDNIFNNKIDYQSYHQISFSYREKLSNKFALGVKLSALLGIQYQKLDINASTITFDRVNDRAYLGLAGTYHINYTPGKFDSHDNLPTFRNPGASISIGTQLKTRDNFNIQMNLKDVGFIHWSGRSAIYNFNAQDTIKDISSRRREDNIYAATYNIIHTGGSIGSFVTPTNGKIELSANKNYWFDYDRRYRYSPTLIVSKEVFYNGMVLALVNPVSYHNLTVSLTSSYNQDKIFSIGGQFMVKTPNVEFYIGSERLLQTGSLLLASQGNNNSINRNASYTGADLFLGFSLKFGSVIEHPMNASYVPLEYKDGFFTRLWNRIFKHGDDY